MLKYFSIIFSILFCFLCCAETAAPLFAKHRHLEKITDYGKLTVIKKDGATSPNRNRNSADAVADNGLLISYQASRADNSMIPIVNLQDAVLSEDKSLLVLLESVLNEDSNKFLNRIVFFDIAKGKIVNGFEFKDENREFESAALSNDNILIIEEFQGDVKKRFLRFYPLAAKKFTVSASLAYELSAGVSDFACVNEFVFVKLENHELLLFHKGKLLSRFHCRAAGGKILISPDSSLINITQSFSEILKVASNKQLYSINFYNLGTALELDFAVPIKQDLSEVLVGSDKSIKKLVNFGSLLDTEYSTSNNIIQYNFKQNILLTLSPKKEEIQLYLPEGDFKELNYNTLRPRSQTLIDELFFIGDNNENILILCESGELFVLAKERKKYNKILLCKF